MIFGVRRAIKVLGSLSTTPLLNIWHGSAAQAPVIPYMLEPKSIPVNALDGIGLQNDNLLRS